MEVFERIMLTLLLVILVVAAIGINGEIRCAEEGYPNTLLTFDGMQCNRLEDGYDVLIPLRDLID